jgi:serine/threonine-protein phosphatase PGAM5
MLDITTFTQTPFRVLYLVRHGHYQRAFTPPATPDGPLTELGAAQAELTGRRLARLPVRVIHHSTLIRARQTAEIIAQYFPDVELRPSPLLRECLPTVPPAYIPYLEGATPADFAQGDRQAREVFRKWFKPPDPDATETTREIVVSSGNLISYLVARTLGAPGKRWVQTHIQHCGVTEVALGGPRSPLLLRHSDTGHLPPYLQTI